jgi:TolB-like protein
MNATLQIIAALLLAFGLGQANAAEPYAQLSLKISKIALRTGYKRLAVLPLQPVSGAGAQSGEVLAARLVSRLAIRPGIEIVERTLLDQVLEEQGLGYKGVIKPEQAKAVGQILGVDAIVTGTYLKLRHDRLEVHARIIDTETAHILGAATAKVKKEWEEEIVIASANVWDTPPPAIVGFEVSADDFAPIPDIRDALSNIDSCKDWETRVNTTQESTIEARARYWATKLRDPKFKSEHLTQNPGSDIRDISLRQRFYNRTEELYQKFYTKGITTREKERLDAAQRQVKRVISECY